MQKPAFYFICMHQLQENQCFDEIMPNLSTALYTAPYQCSQEHLKDTQSIDQYE
jgi:hypothetical protein